MEFYDFAIYGLAAGTVFRTVFFGSDSAAVGFIAAMATFAVGYFARPVGGIILGAVGDKLGRKTILVWTVVVMGLASFCIGLIPTYEQIGIAAPVLLVTMRIVQGLGAGAELASASTLLVETAVPERRGLIGSLVGIGTNGGTLLASLIWLSVSALPDEQFMSWGWRIPFLLSILIAGVGLWLRRGVDESPAYEAKREEQQRETVVSVYRKLLRQSTGKMLACIGMRWAENGTSTVFLVFLVGYLADQAPQGRGYGSFAIVVSAIVGLATVPIMGHLTDLYGRRRMYLILSVFQLVVALPAIWMIETGSRGGVVLAYCLAYSVGVMGMYAVQSSFMVELFGSRSRLAAVTSSKELGALSSGGVAPLISATLLAQWSIWAVGAYLCLLAGVSIVSTLVLPETKGRDLLTRSDA